MTSRRSFLASVAATLAGCSKPRCEGPQPGPNYVCATGQWKARVEFVPGDGSLFNPREDLAAQYNRWNPPAPWVFRV